MDASGSNTAVVLSGGGARAAYQIGALRGVARLLERRTRSPFGVITGTSAGAINAATLAVHADAWRCGIARLLRMWRNIEVGDVYKADFAAVSRHGMRWLSSVLVGARGPADAASMLDNAPLRGLLERALDVTQVEQRIAEGHAARACDQCHQLQLRARGDVFRWRSVAQSMAAHAPARSTREDWP